MQDFSENAMFGLDFVLECEMEQMLNPPGVPWRLKEEQRNGVKGIGKQDLLHLTLLHDGY